jgi:hypothetical protein
MRDSCPADLNFDLTILIEFGEEQSTGYLFSSSVQVCHFLPLRCKSGSSNFSVTLNLCSSLNVMTKSDKNTSSTWLLILKYSTSDLYTASHMVRVMNKGK